MLKRYWEGRRGRGERYGEKKRRDGSGLFGGCARGGCFFRPFIFVFSSLSFLVFPFPQFPLPLVLFRGVLSFSPFTTLSIFFPLFLSSPFLLVFFLYPISYPCSVISLNVLIYK